MIILSDALEAGAQRRHFVMLKVDDRFKAWMRGRLSDRDYADRVMHALVDSKDCTLVKVHPHAALPVSQPDDPEVMIGLIKGHDNVKNDDVLLAIFGDWDEFKDMAQSYMGRLWEIYNPVTRRDFESLPHIYEAAFVQSESEEPLIKRRWTLTSEKDGVVVSEEEYEDLKINLINTSIDSELIQIITGQK